LAEGQRRRTPGLRREEVARLADVGVSWYTWLEQGRDIQVSVPFLERLTRALRLTPTERAYLFALAQGRPAARPMIVPTDVSSALRGVLDAHPFPALVSTMRWDLLAWNEAATVLFGDFASRPDRYRNGLWLAFTDPERRARCSAWERQARMIVARFRLDAARAADRTEFDALATELAQVSPEFAAFWNEHDVGDVTEGAKEIVHPEMGGIQFEYVTLTHLEADGRELRVTLYTPRPGESMERARALFGGIRG
jgi:transcriptional regulator with XRE-family HTH domain